MNIIRFQDIKPNVEKPEAKKLYINNMSFTCTNCGTVSTANFNNMLFRVLDFYCSSCGTNHKVSNPAFSKQHSKR